MCAPADLGAAVVDLPSAPGVEVNDRHPISRWEYVPYEEGGNLPHKSYSDQLCSTLLQSYLGVVID